MYVVTQNASFQCLQMCFNSCFVILLLCILKVNLSIRFSLELLEKDSLSVYSVPFVTNPTSSTVLVGHRSWYMHFLLLLSAFQVCNTSYNCAAFHPTFWVSHLLSRLTYSRIKSCYFAIQVNETCFHRVPHPDCLPAFKASRAQSSVASLNVILDGIPCRGNGCFGAYFVYFVHFIDWYAFARGSFLVTHLRC